MTQCIREELQRELGVKTDVVVSQTDTIDTSLTRIPGTIAMSLSFQNAKTKDGVSVMVFGMKNNELDRTASQLMQNAQKLSPKVVDSLMSAEMRQEVTKLATRVVRNADSMTHACDQLSEVLDEKFGPHWHTVMAHKDMMAVDDHRKISVFFVKMDFGDMRVSVFK